MNRIFTVAPPDTDGFEMSYYRADETTQYEKKVYPPHVGDTVEFYILLEGDVSFAVENHLYKMAPGDILLTKPNELHNCVLNSNGVHRHFCFWFSPKNDFLMHDFLSHGFGEENLISPGKDDREAIETCCRKLYAASLRADDPIGEYSYAIQLISLVHRNLGRQTATEELPPLLESILKDMDNGIATVRSIRFFEDKYFISQSTLNRLFRKYLNTSPMLYLESKRLALARILLRQGKSVTEAAEESGFSDYSNFIRLFRRRFGVTPRRYRNQNET